MNLILHLRFQVVYWAKVARRYAAYGKNMTEMMEWARGRRDSYIDLLRLINKGGMS